MATPDNIKKRSVLPLIKGMVLYEPDKKTINHKNSSMITVLMAVAMLESVFLIPILAKTAVIPAQNAEQNASNTHNFGASLFLKLVLPLQLKVTLRGKIKFFDNHIISHITAQCK